MNYKKICLINAPPIDISKLGFSNAPPLGIAYLASYVRLYCPDVELRIIDGRIIGLNGVCKEVYRFQPDLVGLSFSTLLAQGAYQLTSKIKELFPKIPVIAGGPHPTAMPEEVLCHDIDCVILGEGERAFRDIVMKGEITQKIIRGKLVQSLDSIPFPARDLLDLEKYSKGNKRLPILFTRGCAYNKCTFCANGVWNGQLPFYRARSPQNICDEAQMLKEKYDIEVLDVVGDEFNFNLPWATRVCKEFQHRNIDLAWYGQVRVDNVDEELVKNMAKSGCRGIFAGIESGSSVTLRGIRKGTTLEQVKHSLKLFKEYGIQTGGYFMAFNVWEENGELSYEDIEDTKSSLDYAQNLLDEGLLDFTVWSLTTPFPGSELWNIAHRHNLISNEYLESYEKWSPSWHLVMNLPDISDKDVNDIVAKTKYQQTLSLIKHPLSIRLNRFTLGLAVKGVVKIFRLLLKKYFNFRK